MFLQGNFYHKGKKHKLTLKDSGLTWDAEGTPDLRRTILSSEILSCWVCPRGSISCFPHTHGASKECVHWDKGGGGLSVEVCCRREGRRWSPSVVVFLHAAKEVILTWHEALWTIIKNVKGRPNTLIVVINPIGGRRKGVHNFEKKVAPLFSRAGIHTSKLQTRCKGHGTRLIQEADAEGLLRDCDGIVGVGGDGLVSEIVTGLFLVASSTKGLDPNDFHNELPVTQIRLGIIPSGSTDATCFATHGSSDVVTAALHIIMGDQRSIDVASIHSDDQLQRVVTSLISYGYFGDLLKSSEQYRCLGPTRYFLSGMTQIIKNRTYPVNIRIKRTKQDFCTSSVSSSASCNSICSICNRAEMCAVKGDEEEWEELTGKYSVVSTAVTSCACRLTPQGVSPSAHLGDGFSDLILVDGSSRAKLLSYLYHTSVTGNATCLDHVRMIRTNEIHLSAPTDSLSLFNCDGEELQASSLSIKIHRQKLQMFCRGVEDPFPVNNCKYKTTTRL